MGETTRGFGGGVPSRWRPTRVWGRSPQRCGDFSTFFKI